MYDAMPALAFKSPGFRAVRLGRPTVATDRRPDGTIYLRSTQTLARYPEKLTQRLEYWAAHAPDRILFAQREDGGGWRSLTSSIAVHSTVVLSPDCETSMKQ